MIEAWIQGGLLPLALLLAPIGPLGLALLSSVGAGLAAWRVWDRPTAALFGAAAWAGIMAPTIGATPEIALLPWGIALLEEATGGDRRLASAAGLFLGLYLAAAPELGLGLAALALSMVGLRGVGVARGLVVGIALTLPALAWLLASGALSQGPAMPASWPPMLLLGLLGVVGLRSHSYLMELVVVCAVLGLGALIAGLGAGLPLLAFAAALGAGGVSVVLPSTSAA